MTYEEKIIQLKKIYGKGIELHLSELFTLYENRNNPKEHITQFIERIKRKSSYVQALDIINFVKNNKCECPFSIIPDEVFKPLFEMINKIGSNISLSDEGDFFYFEKGNAEKSI